MGRIGAALVMLFMALVWAQAQSSGGQDQASPSASSEPQAGQQNSPPRSDQPRDPGESSSKDTKVDLSRPPDDYSHPGAGIADTMEFHPYDPHKAEKDIEVGDFYFKRKNYPAAESRYREALEYKPNDAIATYRLAETLDKRGSSKEARSFYEAYIKILPHGPYAEDARKALSRLGATKPESPAVKSQRVAKTGSAVNNQQ